jgi:hypothetical protein
MIARNALPGPLSFDVSLGQKPKRDRQFAVPRWWRMQSGANRYQAD